MLRNRTLPTIVLGVLLCLSGYSGAAEENQQSLDDAWWTGPILAAGAGTLPQGHALIEPYVFDVIRYGRYDNDGDERSAERAHSYGNLTYILYGVTDRFTAGLIPTFGYNSVSNGRDSSSIQLGDVTVQGQYRLTQFRQGSPIPTMSLVVQQTFPTGKYDRLGENVNDGFGSGAYTTTLALYSQYYAWMPNGRILRSRFNVSYALSSDADIEDVSVYGTNPGFRGTASPGDVLTINSAWEYSITREWVFALDLIYQHDASTKIEGTEANPATGQTEIIKESFDSAWRFGVAPAIEYNFSSRIGVIAGARWFVAGRNTSATITPVAAINMVFLSPPIGRPGVPHLSNAHGRKLVVARTSRQRRQLSEDARHFGIVGHIQRGELGRDMLRRAHRRRPPHLVHELWRVMSRAELRDNDIFRVLPQFANRAPGGFIQCLVTERPSHRHDDRQQRFHAVSLPHRCL